MSGACIPSLFLRISLLLIVVHAGFPFSLTIFSLHHTVPQILIPQILKESSTDVSLSPGPGFGGYCIPGLQALAAQD